MKKSKFWLKIGCLAVIAAFLCLFGGCAAFVIFYMKTDEFKENFNSPVVKYASVSTLGWRTLRVEDYNFRYPKDWTLYSSDTNGRFQLLYSENDGNSEMQIVFAYLENNKNSYDDLTEDNFIESFFSDESYFVFAPDVFEKGRVRNNKRAIYGVFSGELMDEQMKIYCYLIENGNDVIWIQGMASDEHHEKYQPVFDTIISTFRLK